MEIINEITKSYNCGKAEARQYLEDEICNLRDLQSQNDLRIDNLETACRNLGLDLDYIDYFLTRIAA